MTDERTEPHQQPLDPGDPTRPSAPDSPRDPGSPPEWPSVPDPYVTGPGQTPPPQWPAPPPVEPQPGPSGVHPLDVGRAFGVGWSLFRFRWKAMLGVAVVVMIPAYLIQAALSVWAADAMERWSLTAQDVWLAAMERGERIDFTDLPPFPFEAIAASFLGGILVGIASVVVGGALVHIIGWTYGGARAAAGSGLRASFNRLPSLLGAGLLAALITFLVVFGGVVLMIALMAATAFQPGPLALIALIVFVSIFAAVIFLAVRWQFFTQAIMLEGASAIGSLGRSWRLVSGSSWRVLGYLLLLFVVLFLVGIVAGVISLALFGVGVDFETGQPTAFEPARAAGQSVVSALVTLLVLPFYMAVMTLLYYDLRWRRQEQIGPPPA